MTRKTKKKRTEKKFENFPNFFCEIFLNLIPKIALKNSKNYLSLKKNESKNSRKKKSQDLKLEHTPSQAHRFLLEPLCFRR